MNHHIEKLEVKYKVFKQDVCERLDNQIEKLANEQGLEFWGSGFNFKTQERDLEFGSEIIEEINKGR